MEHPDDASAIGLELTRDSRLTPAIPTERGSVSRWSPLRMAPFYCRGAGAKRQLEGTSTTGSRRLVQATSIKRPIAPGGRPFVLAKDDPTPRSAASPPEQSLLVSEFEARVRTRVQRGERQPERS
jgi:hypothetical protein